MASKRKPRLVVESGVDKGMVFPLARDVTTLGRSAQNNIQIIDKRMSRHHVEFLNENGNPVLRDLGSKNGTWMNNVRVTGDNPLRDGDRVRIGETVLKFEMEYEDEEERPDSVAGPVKLVAEDWSTNAQHSNTMAAGAAPIGADQIAEAGQRYKRQQAVGEKPAAQGSSTGSASATLPGGRSVQHMQLLIEVGDAIRSIFDFDELLERLMDLVWGAVEPDTGVLFLVDEKTNRFYPKITRDQRDPEAPKAEDEGGDLTVSRTIIDRAAQERVSVLVADAASDERFNASESVIMHRIRSAICAPVVYKEQVLGVLYVSSRKFQSFGQPDLELMTGIANQAAMAISNVRLHKQVVDQQKYEKEMEIARTIQMNLLPKSYPEFQNFDISGMSLPAKHVGGDYFDFVELGGGRWGVAIADVSGKGVPAALLTTTVRASMHVLAQDKTLDPPKMISALNATTCRDSLNNMFVTMVYAIVSDEARQVEFTNAGHAHPILFLPDGGEKLLIEGASFLGIDDEMEFDKGVVDLPPGSILVFYTDGVTDSTDAHEQQFGNERFKKVVRENMHRSAEEIRDAIHEATLKFRGEAPQFDDFTLIVLKCVQ